MSVPEHIGPYRVLRPIATGGTAEVYEVQDPASGERFALKLLVAVATSLKRFNREYEAMIRLNHPSIVRVYHYGLHQGQPWLTMELLRGQPAQLMVKKSGRAGSSERTEVVHRVGYHVAKALHYIHDRKIVHRDLKSANVLVLPDERIKLLDFGAAALLDASERITLDGEFVGTFAYASPEQLMGRPFDHRSDLYSLGVLLFRLATGARPFESDDNDTLARMHIHQRPPDPREVTPGLDPELAQLVLELLAKSPGERPLTADHVAQRLEAMHGRPFSTRSRLAVHEPAAVSREAERRLLWDHLENGPSASCVVVLGEEGSDRVRFLETTRGEAAARDWGAYSCQARPGQSLQRLVDALVTMAQDCEEAEAAPHVERLRAASTPEALANTRDRAALRQAAVSLAQLRCKHGRTVVFMVQEVHRGDVLMFEVLAGLRRALQKQYVPFKLVLSCRAAEVEGAGDVRRLGEYYPILLAPLTPRDVAVAVGNMLGRRPPPSELARRLWEVCAGQPLYLEEAVQDMVGAGGIEADGSRLAWADQTMEIPPPSRAVNAANKVLETLPVGYRRVLEALCVADDVTEPPVVARALGWTDEELAVVMDRLVALGVLRWTRDGALRAEWRQPLLASLVGQAIHPCRRAVLRRALASAVRGLPPTRGGVKALVALGRTAEAVSAAVGLAQALLARGRVRSALEVVAPVVEGASSDDRGPDFAEVFLLHARCLRTVHPTDPTSGRSLVRARAIAEELGDPRLVARVALAQARLYEVIGHYTNFSKYLKAAWDSETTPGTPALAAEIASALAQSSRWHGDLQRSEQWVEQAIEAAERAEDPRTLAEAMVQSATCMLARGHLVEAEETLANAMLLCDRAGHEAGLWSALARWASVLRHQGRFSEALSQLYLRLPEASQSQDPTPYTEMLLATAWIELDLSRLGRAQECTDELAATIHRGEHLHLRLEAQLLNGRILLLSGQYRTAQYVLQEVHRGARSANLSVLAEHARALLAETLFAVGDKVAAAGAFQSAVLGLLGTGDLPVLAEGLRGRARTEATERDPDDIFRPVSKLLDQPMPLLKLEHLLARGAWCRSRGDKSGGRAALRESAIVLNKVATDLNDTDRAALRVHPWSAWIRAGLR